jgi:hypothetical protein
MHMGVPQGVFCSPAPVPAENPSHGHGCGIPAGNLTGFVFIIYINIFNNINNIIIILQGVGGMFLER